MVDAKDRSAVGEDTAGVGAPVRSIDDYRKRSSAEDIIYHFLFSPYCVVIYDRDGDIPLPGIACGCWNVVRIELVVRDATRIANVVVGGLWPAPLAAT